MTDDADDLQRLAAKPDAGMNGPMAAALLLALALMVLPSSPRRRLARGGRKPRRRPRAGPRGAGCLAACAPSRPPPCCCR